MFPQDDIVATGVLDTVAARLDHDPESLYHWAFELERNRFYEILNDHDGEARVFFVALAGGADVDDIDYDRRVGPKVDRIEDAYTTDLPQRRRRHR
jgi:hypothetical protein